MRRTLFTRATIVSRDQAYLGINALRRQPGQLPGQLCAPCRHVMPTLEDTPAGGLRSDGTTVRGLVVAVAVAAIDPQGNLGERGCP